MSKADCYVQLWLPTATPNHAQTRMVANSRDPEWNETFHYQIHSAVKVRAQVAEGEGPSREPPMPQAPTSCLPCR